MPTPTATATIQDPQVKLYLIDAENPTATLLNAFSFDSVRVGEPVTLYATEGGPNNTPFGSTGRCPATATRSKATAPPQQDN